MIYVSSSCIKTNSIEEAIRTLTNEGFYNIELSGGTKYDSNILTKLIELKEELNVNLLLHNYFPTPKTPFVLNLASLDKKIATYSLEHVKKAIDWSVKLGAKKYAFHAGFLINIALKQIGKKIEKVELFNEKQAIEQFEKNLIEIEQFNSGRLQLYIENNVLSESNYTAFDNIDPFFFTSSKNLNKFNRPEQTGMLLDAAHLKVSCNSLSLNFEQEFEKLYTQTDYFHISDNDGTSDTNREFTEGSVMFSVLEKFWNPNKTVTIEVYTGIQAIKETHKTLEKLNKCNE